MAFYKDPNGVQWILIQVSGNPGDSRVFGTPDPNSERQYSPEPPDTSVHGVSSGADRALMQAAELAVRAEIDRFAKAHRGEVQLRVTASKGGGGAVLLVVLVLLALADE